MQAKQARMIVEAAGSPDVCSVCGDDPTNDFQLAPGTFPIDAVVSVRLCDDCHEIRSNGGERLINLEK